MQQYFLKGQVKNPVEVMDKDTCKHMFQVMRLVENDQVVLVFEDGIKRLARVVDKDMHQFEILQELEDQVELPVKVSIACGFPKGDKLEWVAQKATELGAYEISAYPGDWSVAKWDGKKLAKKVEKLEKIVLGAAEQSKRNRIPEVQLFEKKSAFLESFKDYDKILVAYEESAKEGESAALAHHLSQMSTGQKLLFIFGPEGGLSPEEIALFKENGAILVGLGPRIMRAETAPLYALSAVSVLTELL